MMHRTQVRGLSIAYERVGNGPALVLLHGFSHDLRAWAPQIESLSSHFKVIAWDAPGAGQSSDPPEVFGFADWADCLAGLLDAAGAERAHIIGLSWGGILAQYFYQRHPRRVLSLVLADTYAGWRGSLPEPVVEERLAACLDDASLAPSEFVAQYLPGMFSNTPPQAAREALGGIMLGFHPVGFRRMAIASAAADTRDLLAKIQVPTQLIWGDSDVRSPMTVAEQFLHAVPGARLVIIPMAGHVSNLEAPAEFTAAVRDFCLHAAVT